MNSLRLNSNALKIIAMVTMFLDHFGMIFFPDIDTFRIIGRISFPIYAYLISEGCKYTSNRKLYFLRIFGLGLICSTVFIIVERYVYMCVLITFSLSILLIYLIDYVRESFQTRLLLLLLSVVAIRILCNYIEVDYDFFGILVPVIVYIANDRRFKLALFTISLIFLIVSCLKTNPLQIYSLLSVIFVALYNGERGKLNLKKFFYLFYPVHLALLWIVYAIINYS